MRSGQPKDPQHDLGRDVVQEEVQTCLNINTDQVVSFVASDGLRTRLQEHYSGLRFAHGSAGFRAARAAESAGMFQEARCRTWATSLDATPSSTSTRHYHLRVSRVPQ